MAFEGLSEKLNATFKRLRGKGRLTEADVREGMREVRLALLEADVSYKVVKDFVAQVTERCIGADVLDSLTPAQQIVKIVNEELVQLMGGTNAKLTFASKGPTVVMMVGLQGAGKTTNGAKLAGLMRRQFGKRPLLVACDVSVPPPSPSCRWWASSWIFPFSRWDRPIPCASPRRPSNTPGTTATTWCFWTPLVVCTWTRL